MSRIIVAAPPIPGELMPLLQIGRGLAERGHEITVLTGTALRKSVEAAGLAFAPLSRAADYDFQELVSRSERTSLPPGPPQLTWDLTHAFINPMADQYAGLSALLEDDPEQLLIANTLFLGAWPAALGAQGPRPRRWLAVSAVPLALSSVDTTPFGPLPVSPGEDAKAAHRLANAAFNAALRPADDRLNEMLIELGAEPSPSPFTDGIYTLADETAVLTVPEFEFERSDLPAHVHLVGILPAHEDADWQPPSWWGELDLDRERPVVVVTQGTLANHDLSQLIEPTLAGLAELDVTIVAALGRDPEGLSVPVPENARVAEFIPFGTLLPKADVLVTNGGFGATQQALALGVPVVVAGATEDKPANAARVAHHGVGIDLQTATPTAAAVAAAVTAILDDVEVRENARQIAKAYARHDVISAVERLLLG